MSFTQKMMENYISKASGRDYRFKVTAAYNQIFLVVGDNDIDCAYKNKADAQKHVDADRKRHQRIIAVELYDSFEE